MTIAAAVKRFLDGHGIVYHVSNHARTATLQEAATELGICHGNIARSVLLKDHLGMVMAVLPVTHRLDFKRLKQILKRDLTVVTGKEADKLFADCEPGSRPPIAEAYGLECIVDRSLTHCGDIYFEPGTHHAIVHVANRDFQDLLTNAVKGDFAYQAENSSIALEACQRQTQNFHRPTVDIDDFESCLQAVNRLPNIDWVREMLTEIPLQASLDESLLTKMQHLQPINDAIVLHNNHVVNPINPIRNIQEVIAARYPSSLSLALASGILAVQALKVACMGPFGANQIWRHAIFSASLSYWIAQDIAEHQDIDPVMAFSGGLLQNIGILLLGYLYEPEYQLMNRLATASPRASLAVIERKVLGMGQARDLMSLGHERLGAWLIKHWGAADQITAIALEHHNPLVENEHKALIKVVQLANIILDEQGFNDSLQTKSLDSMTSELGIDSTALASIYDKLTISRFALESIAQLIV